MADRVPPHNLGAQEALIGACLLSRDALRSARAIVNPDDFYGSRYQEAWATMCLLDDAGEAVDVITVAPGITSIPSNSAVTWLHELQNATPAISSATSYANTVLHASKLRSLIYFGSDLVEAAYQGSDPTATAHRIGAQLIDDERLRRNEIGDLRGFYDDIATLDPGTDRDEAQPWIAHGLLRRGQRLMVVAKAGIGKSTFLRQLAFCAAAGVHPLTGQPTGRRRSALIVELEAGSWDITDSMRNIILGIQRSLNLASAFDAPRPALLHRQGGLDLRSPAGRSALEAAIQRARPEIVCMGPVKYMGLMQPGENYETATLALHGILNDLIARYGFALALEAHFSRGDHGAPGGSERWVDWPDVGFGIHPPENDITSRTVASTAGQDMPVKQFRIPRDGGVWLPSELVRGASRRLPWSVDDRPDPMKSGVSLYAARYGGVPASEFVTHVQGEF